MIEREAMYKLTYGLFMLTTTDGQKQNGCIVNTVSMLTDNPTRIVVFVNKANYSEELLRKTGVFNVSILSESAPFDIFKQFGFQSGRDVDKFEGGMYALIEKLHLREHALPTPPKKPSTGKRGRPKKTVASEQLKIDF